MTATDLLRWLESEYGVKVTLAAPGDLDVAGDEKAMEKALPLLRERKAEIVGLLAQKQLPEVVKGLNHSPTCVECQPSPAEESMRQVRSPGEIIRALGYGCGKCGHRVYRQAPAGWLCERCGKVFILIGGSRGPVPVH